MWHGMQNCVAKTYLLNVFYGTYCFMFFTSLQIIYLSKKYFSLNIIIHRYVFLSTAISHAIIIDNFIFQFGVVNLVVLYAITQYLLYQKHHQNLQHQKQRQQILGEFSFAIYIMIMYAFSVILFLFIILDLFQPNTSTSYTRALI